MDEELKTLKELQEQIAAAQPGSGVDLKLLADVAAYAEARNAEGVALHDVADELGIARWQLTDWIERAKKRSNRLREPVGATLKLMVELPLGVLSLDGLPRDSLSLIDVADQLADGLKDWAAGTSKSSSKRVPEPTNDGELQ